MLTCSCGFTCDRAHNMQTHRESKQHEINLERLSRTMEPKVNGDFCCESCQYSTPHRANYRKHMLTSKHQKNIVSPPPQEVKPVLLLEVMDMFFKHQTEILKHHTDILIANAGATERQQIQHTEMFRALTDRVLAHQQSLSPQKVMLDQSSTTTTTNNSHNKKFNLNLFLNEDCKNAQNLSDFVKNVVISLEDLEHLGEVGYTEGMSKILSKAIQSKDKTERPMHCTDVKRETIYIRENDTWKKDMQQEETVRAIEHIAHKNYKAFKEWRDQHPEHEVDNTEDYDTWYRISRNMCNTDPLALKKLVQHLATITAIEKGELM